MSFSIVFRQIALKRKIIYCDRSTSSLGLYEDLANQSAPSCDIVEKFNQQRFTDPKPHAHSAV